MHACDRRTERQIDRWTDGRTELRLPTPKTALTYARAVIKCAENGKIYTK